MHLCYDLFILPPPPIRIHTLSGIPLPPPSCVLLNGQPPLPSERPCEQNTMSTLCNHVWSTVCEVFQWYKLDRVISQDFCISCDQLTHFYLQVWYFGLKRKTLDIGFELKFSPHQEEFGLELDVLFAKLRLGANVLIRCVLALIQRNAHAKFLNFI